MFVPLTLLERNIMAFIYVKIASKYCCGQMASTMKLLNKIEKKAKDFGHEFTLKTPDGWKPGETILHWDYVEESFFIRFNVS